MIDPRPQAPSLPPPDPEAAALSERLTARIHEAIGSDMIGFDRFMAMALYEPGLGYYSAGMTKFGAAGDFTTAPLISPLFSRTLARQCAQCLRQMQDGVILELGAGSGQMALDLLQELQALGQLPAQYLILELSATLRQRQQELLAQKAPALAERVRWLDALPAQPIQGVIVANEVLDALPVQRFCKSAEGVAEIGVAAEDGHFLWRQRPAAPALAAAVAAIERDLGQPLAVGYSSEHCPTLAPWLAALAQVLERGVLLLVDYGYPRREYYHPQRHMGTLICHYRHRSHDDPLTLVGLQDITAFVDFSAVAEAGVQAGLELLGYAPQAQFLLGAGLAELVTQQMAQAEPAQQLRLAQQVKALTLPGEMGERFKVLALGKNFDRALAGFGLVDHSGRL